MLLLAGLDNPAAWTLDAGKGDRRVSNRPFPLGVALSLCDKSQKLCKDARLFTCHQLLLFCILLCCLVSVASEAFWAGHFFEH